MTVGQLAHGAQIGHRYGLSAGRIVGDGYNDERHTPFVFAHGLFKFGYVNVAFERMLQLGVAGFVDGAVNRKSLAAFDVAFGCIEV